MRIHKLKNQFLINYVFIFIILITLASFVFMLNQSYETSRYDRFSIDIDILIEDVSTLSLEEAVSNQNISENDYIEILDPEYRVLEQYNSPHSSGFQYSTEAYDELIYGEMSFSYYTYFDESTQRIYLFYLEPFQTSQMYVVLIIGAILIFTIFTFRFASFSAKQIVQPVYRLVEGVEEVGQGNYDHVIAFEASEEFNHLRDSFNKMSKKIKKETELRKLADKNQKKLIANLSHDIKTPLTNILGYSESLLLEESLKNKTIKNDIETIYNYANLANQLTNNLFELTYLSVADRKKPFETVDMVELLRQRVIEYISEFDNRNIQYNLEFSRESIYCEVLPFQIKRVFNNLLQNAMKYNKDNFELKLSLEVESRRCIVIVQDNGIGIPKEYHESIFNPLVKVDQSRNYISGGAGLGLSIAKKIIENHNGTIELDQQYEDGCRFIITLPLTQKKKPSNEIDGA